ncbi:hypothetical protein [Ulvibacterium marinum]|uniref:hypothetical protein n=1 Tax=Ulvibacterium marinum TaxID=2419782 RepID=UPI0024954DC8|nr:hypothetical protein [Ulvibacterium marinum]
MIYVRGIQITPFDKKRWVVNTSDGNHLLVNGHTKNLLDILVDSSSEQEALEQFNQEFGQNLDKKSFEDLLQHKFENANVLQSEEPKSFRKKSYLNFKIKLFNAKIAGLLSSPFVFLFNPVAFWLLFGTCLVFTVTVGFVYFSFDSTWINVNNLVLYSTIMYATMLIHELGHIAACRKFGVDHGEIGFGFYSIFPVVYADVTHIWTLDKHKRTITNLGGIYLEIIYASIWSTCYLISREEVFLIASFSILFKTLTELNPFIRFDGYWVILDLTNTPNLLPKANAMVRSIVARIKGKKTSSATKWGRYHYLLAAYGLVNWGVFSLYVLWMIQEYWQSILGYPVLIGQIFSEMFSGNIDSLMDIFSFENLMILGFYLLLGRQIIKWTITIFKINRSVAKPGLKGMDPRRPN